MIESVAKYHRYLQRYTSQLSEQIAKEYGWVSEVPGFVSQVTETILNLNELKNLKKGTGIPTIVIPGFTVGNSSTVFLRRILEDRGHNMIPWTVLLNRGFYKEDIDSTLDQVKATADYFGTKVNLVGHSLGGCYARSIANTIPDHVQFVITMGSPIKGIDLIDVSTRDKYDKIIGFVDACFIHHSEYLDTFINSHPNIHTTSMFSEYDSVVHWSLSEIDESDTDENIKIHSGHFAMGFSIETAKILADRLSQNPEKWSKWRDCPVA